MSLNSQTPQQKIRQELLDSQLKVASLQDLSLQLLVHSQGSDCLEAKEKVHVIGNRLKLLLKEVTRDLRELAKILDITSSQQDLSSWSSADDLDTSGSLSPVSGRSTPSRQRSLAMLLLVVLAFLLPMTEEDYCGNSNNLAHSFYPMLRYTNGPPPV
ncbi:Nesprin-1 [Liparis tanakae]|uniref:Nesprin-1 n=1 Tax=Liparis tanakae TaxID=230148 RepID=A0A4Z2GJ03_9TELE|nr:Nesprin-1 [Liparis tanakae]